VKSDPRAQGATASGSPERAQRPAREPDHERRTFNVLGKPLRRIDAIGKVTGETRFADDLSMPGMLFMKLVRSTVPHARIVSIDAGPALAVEGVRAVLTGELFPVPLASCRSRRTSTRCAPTRCGSLAIRSRRWSRPRS